MILEVAGVSLCEYIAHERTTILSPSLIENLMSCIYQNHLLRCNLIINKLPGSIFKSKELQKLLETKKVWKTNSEVWKLMNNNNTTIIELFQSIIMLETEVSNKEIPLLKSIEFIFKEIEGISIAEVRDIISRSLEESVSYINKHRLEMIMKIHLLHKNLYYP